MTHTHNQTNQRLGLVRDAGRARLFVVAAAACRVCLSGCAPFARPIARLQTPAVCRSRSIASTTVYKYYHCCCLPRAAPGSAGHTGPHDATGANRGPRRAAPPVMPWQGRKQLCPGHAARAPRANRHAAESRLPYKCRPGTPEYSVPPSTLRCLFDVTSFSPRIRILRVSFY